MDKNVSFTNVRLLPRRGPSVATVRRPLNVTSEGYDDRRIQSPNLTPAAERNPQAYAALRSLTPKVVLTAEPNLTRVMTGCMSTSK